MDAIRSKLISKIYQKYEQYCKCLYFDENDFKNMIIGDFSQILLMAMKNKEIKDFERVEVKVKDGVVDVSTKIWPITPSTQIKFEVKVDLC